MLAHATLAVIASSLALVQVETLDPGAMALPAAPALERRVGPQLAALLRAQRTGGAVAFRDAARRLHVDLGDGDTAEVRLSFDRLDRARAAAAKWRAAGRAVLEEEGATLRVALPLRDAAWLEGLRDELPGLVHLALPPQALPLATSQGVNLTGASVAHALGAAGQGTRIAVIDTGFVGYTELKDLGLLPKPVKKKTYVGSGVEKGSEHGTAVAQIAHQMAPQAGLILIRIGSIAHFDDALAFARQAGAIVANVSLAFPGANFSDGTGPAAKAVKKAWKDGLLTVVAAGNHGDGHWLGNWSDPDKDQFLDFSPGDPGLTFFAPAGRSVLCYVVWDDFPETDRDLALQVHYVGTDANPQAPSEQNLVDFSDVVQDGDQLPFEIVSFVTGSTGNYAAFVRRVDKKPGQVAVFVSEAVIDGNNVAASSIGSPADAQQALTVGAVWHFNWPTGPIQAFSSQGPTTAGLAKPDLVGPDGVANDVFGSFFGTSASAPHVAGAAAVLASAIPQLGVKDLRQRLIDYAVPMGEVNVFGEGRLDLFADFLPPAPNPPAVDGAGSTASHDQVQLAAVAMSDATPPLEYAFDSVGGKKLGGTSSGWQLAPTFVDDGLLPDRLYRYALRVRDSAVPRNKTVDSPLFGIRTHAAVPPPPKAKKVQANKVVLAVKRGANPKWTRLALFDETLGEYRTPGGAPAGAEPFFAKASKWSSVKVKGLLPATSYSFRARARNKTGVVTDLSAPLVVVTAD